MSISLRPLTDHMKIIKYPNKQEVTIAPKGFLTKSPKAVNTAPVKSEAEKSPSVSGPSPKNKSATPTDDLQCLQAGIEKYTGIKEHGMSVWVVGKVKVKLDELKFRSRNTIGCRAFTNAALEFVLEKYGDELIKMFKSK